MFYNFKAGLCFVTILFCLFVGVYGHPKSGGGLVVFTSLFRGACRVNKQFGRAFGDGIPISFHSAKGVLLAKIMYAGFCADGNTFNQQSPIAIIKNIPVQRIRFLDDCATMRFVFETFDFKTAIDGNEIEYANIRLESTWSVDPKLPNAKKLRRSICRISDLVSKGEQGKPIVAQKLNRLIKFFFLQKH